MHLIYTAVVTQAIISCLTGQIPVVEVTPAQTGMQMVLYGPAYFGKKISDAGEFGVYAVSPREISADEFCRGSQNWCDVALVSSLPLISQCPDLFPVVREEQNGRLWYGMYFYHRPDCPVPAKILGGQGTVLAFVQEREVEFLDASEFFAPPSSPEQMVPADVVNSTVVSFLPPDRVIKMGVVHVVSLVVGLCVIGGLYALLGLPLPLSAEYSGD